MREWRKLVQVVVIGGVLVASVLGIPAGVQAWCEPSSGLVYPIIDPSPGYCAPPYASDSKNPSLLTCNAQDSFSITICDTQDGPAGAMSTRVRLNVVCGATKDDPFCKGADIEVALTYHGCVTLESASLPLPCKRGYAFAYAINEDGDPISYDFLIGSLRLTSTTGRGTTGTTMDAIALQSNKSQETFLGELNGDALTFGPPPADYRALPTTLHGTFRTIPATIDTDLVLLTLGTVVGAQNPVSRVNLRFWNANEVPFSAAHEFVCWDRVPLTSIDPHFAAAGLGTAFGSLQVTAASTCPLPGLCPPFAPFSSSILGILVERATDGVTEMAVRGLFHTGSKATTFFPK